MSMIGQMELVSLLAAFCVFFVAIPAAVSTRSSDGSWVFRAASGFVLVSLFFRVAIMFIGLLGANFPGIIAALWVIWLIGMLIWSRGGRASDIIPRLRLGFLQVLQAIERKSIPGSGLPIGPVSRTCALLCVLAALTLMHRAWYPLHNLRYSRIETYSRTLDLQKFAHLDSPVADGAAYILEPLRVFSGLYPDSVIRFSGPLFSTLLVLAVAFCAFRFLRSVQAGLIAAALMAAWPVLAGIQHSGEISSAELAAVYWVLGAAFLAARGASPQTPLTDAANYRATTIRERFRTSLQGRSWQLAVYALSTALLVSWRIAPVVLVAAVCVPLAYAIVRLIGTVPVRFRSIPVSAAVGVTVLMLLADCAPAVADGPFEYEAAARACRSIATQFPRNEWLIISPVHELAFTYGRGWHFELLDFAFTHSIGQTSLREFTFPYNVKDIFVFVEKQPLSSLRQGGNTDDFASLDLTQTMDRSVLAYDTGLGRASIEFQAGALLSAYAANHVDVSIFHEDERFIVFHVKGKLDKPRVAKVTTGYGG
jgi:hypothetical protein